MNDHPNNLDDSDPSDPDPQTLPFVAPCCELRITAPFNWLKKGWSDILNAPFTSLSFGFILVCCSYLITYLSLKFSSIILFLSLLSGFIFLGPILAMAFYEISLQIEKGNIPTLSSTFQASLKHLSDQMIFGLMLMIVFLIWLRAASMVHVFFPQHQGVELKNLLMFLLIGSLIGSLFALFIFCISALSLPMVVDRKVDMITATVTSVNAVLRNKGAMFVWIICIIGAIGFGLLTAFVGLAISMPLIGHATWHAYMETIDPSDWPKND